MTKKYTIQLIIVLCAIHLLQAQDFSEENNENDLFDDTVTVIDSKEYLDTNDVSNGNKSKRVTFSGNIIGSSAEVWSRQWFKSKEAKYADFRGAIIGGFNTDIRLPLLTKSFIATELLYDASLDTVDFFLKELFLDWNIKKRIYFRMGKQILQWGRGYFFNPVDLVNIEKTNFFNDLIGRKGTYGIKLHVPQKTIFNLYSFLDMGKVQKFDSVALALKTEFTVKATEFAFSCWLKNKVDPVYGFDFSTRIGVFSLVGELALHQSIDTFSIWNDTIPFSVNKAYWIPRISLGIGRYFDFLNINDRILCNFEFYYNHAGKEYRDMTPFFPDSLEDPELIALIFNLFFSHLIRLNSMSKWYASAFLTINQFIIPDMTYTTSILMNLNHRCAMLTGGINYTTLHNLSFSLIVNSFIGQDYTEYTIFGAGMGIEGRVGISF